MPLQQLPSVLLLPGGPGQPLGIETIREAVTGALPPWQRPQHSCPATTPSWLGAGGPCTSGSPTVGYPLSGGHSLTCEGGVGVLPALVHSPAQPPHAAIVPAPGPCLKGAGSCKSPGLASLTGHPHPLAVPRGARVPFTSRGAWSLLPALTAALLVGAIRTGLGEVAAQLCPYALPSALTGHLPSRAGACAHLARQPDWRRITFRMERSTERSFSSAIPSSHDPLPMSVSLALHPPALSLPAAT